MPCKALQDFKKIWPVIVLIKLLIYLINFFRILIFFFNTLILLLLNLCNIIPKQRKYTMKTLPRNPNTVKNKIFLIFLFWVSYNPLMAKKKNEKIPYQEYRALKEKESKLMFKITPYPWPVLATLFVPLTIFIVLILYYIFAVRNFTE